MNKTFITAFKARLDPIIVRIFNIYPGAFPVLTDSQLFVFIGGIIKKSNDKNTV